MAKKIAFLLAGCGHRDGSEIHEATCTLLALDRADCEVTGLAPDRDQTVVTNHLNGDAMNEKRNMMHEAARIMRGNVRPLSQANADNFDALVMPGGFGAALNLCNYGKVGRNCEISSEVKELILGFVRAKKPIGAICIAPVILAKALEGSGVKVTITTGSDAKTAADVESMGATHKNCRVDDCVVDRTNKIVTTPAYMLAKRISEVNAGISRLVDEIAKMIGS